MVPNNTHCGNSQRRPRSSSPNEKGTVKAPKLDAQGTTRWIIQQISVLPRKYDHYGVRFNYVQRNLGQPCVKDGGGSFWRCISVSTAYPIPLSIKLRNDAGDEIECDGCITNLTGGQQFNFGTNFGACFMP